MKSIAIFLYSKSKIVAQPWADAGVECHLFDMYKEQDSDNMVHHVGDIRQNRKTLGRLVRENNCILIGSFTPCTDMAVCGSRHFEKKALQDAMFWAKAMELVFIGLDLADYFDIPYFIENPRTVLGTLLGRKADFRFHPWQFGAYLPEDHQHSLFPEIYPPRDAYPKETWIWIGNGLNIPDEKAVIPVGKDYPGWKKLGVSLKELKRFGRSHRKDFHGHYLNTIAHKSHYITTNKIMKNQKEWLERASNFNLGECIIYNRPIEIQAREQMDGSIKWVLKMHEWVLGKDGEFHREPMPSSRTDEFIENTRFNTPDECHSFWVENVKVEKPLYA